MKLISKIFIALTLATLPLGFAMAAPLVTCEVKDGGTQTLIEAQGLLDLPITNNEIRLPLNGRLSIRDMRLQINDKRAFTVLVRPAQEGSRLDLEKEEQVWNVNDLAFEVTLSELWSTGEGESEEVGAVVASATFSKSTRITFGGAGLSHFYVVSCASHLK